MYANGWRSCKNKSCAPEHVASKRSCHSFPGGFGRARTLDKIESPARRQYRSTPQKKDGSDEWKKDATFDYEDRQAMLDEQVAKRERKWGSEVADGWVQKWSHACGVRLKLDAT